MTETRTAEIDDAPSALARLYERQAALEERVGKLETALAPGPAVVDDVGDRVMARLPAPPQPFVGIDRVLVLHPAVDDLPPPPSGAVPQPPEADGDATRKSWFLFQLLTEFRLAMHMYFDPRYRISRTTQFAIPGIAALLLVNYFLFAAALSVPILSPILERAIDAAIIVIGYKLMLRELDRYREVLDYLVRYGRR